jgi:putative transposase
MFCFQSVVGSCVLPRFFSRLLLGATMSVNRFAWNSFLNDAPSQSLQQVAKTLDRAFKDAFDPAQPNKRIPVFKKLGKNEAGIRYPQGFSLDQGNSVIKLPKLGWLKYQKSRDIKGVVKKVAISKRW